MAGNDHPEPLGPGDIQALASSFQRSRVLLTAFELDLFTAVQALPGDWVTALELAQRLDADLRGVERLADACCALGLLRKQGGRYANTPAGQRHLVRSHPDCLTGLDHLSGLYGRWATLTGAVRAGTSVLDETHDPEHRLDTEAFIEAMHRRGKAQAEEAARLLQPFLPADASPRVLDVGGGSGVFAMALCRAVPGLTAVVLDQPRVAPLARRYVRDAGLEERVAVREGDLTADSLADDAGGFHCVLVSAIVHMLGPDEIRDLLVRCARACAPGGVVAVKDFLMEPERTSPAFGAVFALNMLVNTPRGDTYTETELRRWLEEAGLDHAERVPSAVSEADLLVARKP